MPRRDHSSCSCLTTASILKVRRSSRADGSDRSRAEQRYKELDILPTAKAGGFRESPDGSRFAGDRP